MFQGACDIGRSYDGWLLKNIEQSGISSKCNGFGLLIFIKRQETQTNIMIWLVFVIKSKETHANIMVSVVFCYQKSGNSRNQNGLGCLLLSKVRKPKDIAWFVCFFFLSKVRKLKEITWFVQFSFLKSRVRKLKQIYWFGMVFGIESQEPPANIMV